MALLEYADLTVPDLVKKSVVSFYHSDPLLKQLQSKQLVKRSGGTQVRFKRIKGGHSDVTEINDFNMSVPLVRYETYSTMTGDWTRYIKPIILPHITRDRLPTPGEKAQWVKEETDAAMMALRNDVVKQIYMGNVTTLAGLGTLNGYNTTGTSAGFANGALRFQTPAAQSAAAITYLNETRTLDAAAGLDNWYNQFVAMTTGIGTDFLSTFEEIKFTADSFADDNSAITLGICNIQDHVAMAEEVRSYPGGANNAAALQYTVDDLNSGKAHPSVHIVNGVQFYSNRFVTDAAIDQTGTISTDHVYLLNPSGIEYWVNANNDFRVTKFQDHLEVSNTDADVGYIILEIQFAVSNLLTQGCTCVIT